MQTQQDLHPLDPMTLPRSRLTLELDQLAADIENFDFTQFDQLHQISECEMGVNALSIHSSAGERFEARMFESDSSKGTLNSSSHSSKNFESISIELGNLVKKSLNNSISNVQVDVTPFANITDSEARRMPGGLTKNIYRRTTDYEPRLKSELRMRTGSAEARQTADFCAMNTLNAEPSPMPARVSSQSSSLPALPLQKHSSTMKSSHSLTPCINGLSLPSLKSQILAEFDSLSSDPVQRFESQARAGDSIAQFSLGFAYLRGTGTLKNDVLAMKWLKLAALNPDGQNIDAQYYLARLYFKKGDFVDALFLFQLCASQNEKACYHIGLFHYNGLGSILKDYREALIWFRDSSAYKKSQCMIANCYYFGYSVSQDYAQALEWYSKAGALGCVDAQFRIGLCYKYGYGTVKDAVKALQHFQIASRNLHLEAKYNLATAYYHGYGVSENLKYATKLFLESAEAGNSQSQNAIGQCYQIGRGVDQNYTIAAKYYNLAAERGHSEAQCNLAMLYQRGLGVKVDSAKALRLYRLSAEHENSNAMYNIGLGYQLGNGVWVNRTRAVEWFEKAALLGNDKGQLALGRCFYWGLGIEADFDDSVKWLTLAAKQENTDAMYYLGQCCEKGRGLAKDHDAALQYYRRAAGNPRGHADAELSIGKMYYHGYKVAKDLGQAGTWFEMSANKSNAEAQFYLGRCYYEGSGYTLDYKRAVSYFMLAAMHDNADSQHFLGKCYEKGHGRAKSIVEAASWYDKAAKLGCVESIRRLKNLSFKIRLLVKKQFK